MALETPPAPPPTFTRYVGMILELETGRGRELLGRKM